MSPVWSHPFFVQDLPGFLLVLVVTHHDVLAVHQDLARDVFGIGRVDLHLDKFREETPAGTGLEFVVGSEADERSAFGHAVSNRDREFDTHQKCFGFHIHRCTPTMKMFTSPPNDSIIFLRITERRAVFSSGIFIAILIGPFSSSGSTCLR